MAEKDVPAASPAPAYTVAMTAEHTARIAKSPFVHPLRGSRKNLAIGESRGWPADPVVPRHPIFAYRITDERARGEKIPVILATGNHNSEHTGSWAFQGAVDFLLGKSPEAVALRRMCEFYVYPLVNPDGRYTLKGRGSPQLEARGLKDHNRAWLTEGQSTSIDLLKASMRTHPRAPVRFLLDFHSTRTTQLFVHPSLEQSPFVNALAQRDPAVSITPRTEPPGSLRGWARDEEGLNIPYTYTPELGRAESAARSMEIGKHHLLALHDVIRDVPAPNALNAPEMSR